MLGIKSAIVGTERVTVSIPYFNCPEYIHRAVSSILNQTHENLLVVVVNDGDKNSPRQKLLDINDPRLLCFDLPKNYGRYFADQVVLNSTPDKYFLIQDADDWSESERVTKLLESIKRDQSNAAISTVRMHTTPDYSVPIMYKNWYPERNIQPGKELTNRLGHYGLFSVSALKDIGGYFGGYRISYDRLIMNLLLMTGKVSFVDVPLYNYCRRQDSLTLSPATNMNSGVRCETIARLKSIYDQVYPQYISYLSGNLDRKTFVRLIRKTIRCHITSDQRTDLIRASFDLRQRLSCGL